MKKNIVVISIILVALLIIIGFFFFWPEENKQSTEIEGLSLEKAIVITETNESDGIAAEYDYLKEKGCPSNEGVKEVEKQKLLTNEGKMYDLLYVICNDGSKLRYYFNIDNFFGNWEE